MHVGRLLTFGFFIYATVFMAWTFLYSYGFVAVAIFGETARVVSYSILVVSVFWIARYLRILTWREAFCSGGIFVVTYILLDVIYLPPAAGFEALLSPVVWINWALVFLTPFTAMLYAQHASRTKFDASKNDIGATHQGL